MTRDIITSHMCICQVASQQLLPRRSLGAKGKLPQALWPSKALVSAASYDLRGTLEMILKDLKDQISFGNDHFLNIPRIPTAEIWPSQTFKHRSSPRDPTTDNPKIHKSREVSNFCDSQVTTGGRSPVSGHGGVVHTVEGTSWKQCRFHGEIIDGFLKQE